MTFIEVAEKTLEKTRIPLSPSEIWNLAKELGIVDQFHTKGKTPWATISARIYTDIRDNENSPFVQISKRPVKFFLKRLATDEIKPKQEVEKGIEKPPSFNKGDIHPRIKGIKSRKGVKRRRARKRKLRTLTTAVTTATAKQLRIYAAERDLRMRDVINEALKEYFAKRRKEL